MERERDYSRTRDAETGDAVRVSRGSLQQLVKKNSYKTTRADGGGDNITRKDDWERGEGNLGEADTKSTTK
jgi:hypothetical protein